MFELGVGITSYGVIGKLLNTVASIVSLFQNEERGVYYDPSDKADLDWRRNLLVQTENFADGFWTLQTGATKSPNSAEAPDGTITACTVTLGAISSSAFMTLNVQSPGTHTYSIWAKRAGESNSVFKLAAFNTTDGDKYSEVFTATDTWQRFTFTITQAGASSSWRVASGLVAGSVLIWHPQLETGSVATDYQRITDVNTEIRERFPKATLFQDAAGTIPATSPGQPVGLVLDKSRGLVMGPELILDPTALTSNNGCTVERVGNTLVITNNGVGFGVVEFRFPSIAGQTGSLAVSFAGRRATRALVYAGNLSGNTPYNTGATPLTGVSQSYTSPFLRFHTDNNTAGAVFYIDLPISAKFVPGNHASQPTAAARPTLGRHPKGGLRNLLLQTEDLTIGGKSGGSLVSREPGGYGFAAFSRLTFGDETASRAWWLPVAATLGQQFAASVVVDTNKSTHEAVDFYAGEAGGHRVVWRINSVTGNTVIAPAPSSAAEFSVQGSGREVIAPGVFRYWMVLTTLKDRAIAVGFWGNTNQTANAGKSVVATAAQLERGTIATPYQKVIDQFDVIEAGVPDAWYLHFNGVNQFLSTPAIDFTNSDEMFVAAAVRKLSDGQYPTIAQLSPVWVNTTGTITFSGNIGQGYAYGSRGTATNVSTVSGFLAPDSAVLSGVSEITPPKTILRVNGIQIAESLGNQGTGNYSNNPLFIGMRGGVDQPLHGHLYGLVVRGKLPTEAELTATETILSNKMRIAS